MRLIAQVAERDIKGILGLMLAQIAVKVVCVRVRVECRIEWKRRVIQDGQKLAKCCVVEQKRIAIATSGLYVFAIALSFAMCRTHIFILLNLVRINGIGGLRGSG